MQVEASTSLRGVVGWGGACVFNKCSNRRCIDQRGDLRYSSHAHTISITRITHSDSGLTITTTHQRRRTSKLGLQHNNHSKKYSPAPLRSDWAYLGGRRAPSSRLSARSHRRRRTPPVRGCCRTRMRLLRRPARGRGRRGRATPSPVPACLRTKGWIRAMSSIYTASRQCGNTCDSVI